MLHSPIPPHAPEPPAHPGRFLVVSFHDLAPHTERPCREFLVLLETLGAPRITLGVVSPWNRAEALEGRPFFLRFLRSLSEAGHEIRLEEEAGLPAPTVEFSSRSVWRRAASRLWARWRFARSRRAPVLQVSVHPGDVYNPAVRRTLLRLLEQSLADRTPVTRGELELLSERPGSDSIQAPDNPTT